MFFSQFSWIEYLRSFLSQCARERFIRFLYFTTEIIKFRVEKLLALILINFHKNKIEVQVYINYIIIKLNF